MQKVSEGKDYELTPSEGSDNDQAWDVRILRGDFAETVVRFGNIRFDDEKDCLLFNYVIQYTPDETLTEEREDLIMHVGDILESVLENAIAEGSLLENERASDT